MTKFIRIVLCCLVAVCAMPLEAHKGHKHHHHPKEEVAGLIISNVWVRAGKPNAAVYLNIINTTDKDRKIVSASAEGVAKKVELHDHLWDNNVMKMRTVEVIDLPAKREMRLSPGGHHIMLLDVIKPLKKGQKIQVKFKLDDGKEVTLNAPVKPMKYRGPKKTKGNGECGCENTEGKPCPCPEEKKDAAPKQSKEAPKK